MKDLKTPKVLYVNVICSYLVSPNLKLIYVILFDSTKIIHDSISYNYRNYLATIKPCFPSELILIVNI